MTMTDKNQQKPKPDDWQQIGTAADAVLAKIRAKMDGLRPNLETWSRNKGTETDGEVRIL